MKHKMNALKDKEKAYNSLPNKIAVNYAEYFKWRTQFMEGPPVVPAAAKNLITVEQLISWGYVGLYKNDNENLNKLDST